MAKKNRPHKTPGMYETRLVANEEEYQACIDSLKCEIAAEQGLDWIRKLRGSLGRLYGPDSKPSDEPLAASGREAFQLADAILADDFATLTLPQIVRRCYRFGRVMERWVLQKHFDGMVASARVVSKVSKEKAKKSVGLKDNEWAKVAKYIERRCKAGAPAAQACADAAKQLKTGVFPGVGRAVLRGASKSNLQNRWSGRLS